MSSNDASDPSLSDDLDDELAALLAGDLPTAGHLDPEAVEPRSEEDGSGTYGSSFDIDRFMADVRKSGGVFVVDTMIDVPLEAFVEASRHDALHELRISSGDDGQPFLVGVVATTDGLVALASVTLS